MKKVIIAINGFTKTVYMSSTAARQLVVDYETRGVDATVEISDL
jgi:hypothetical protein